MVSSVCLRVCLCMCVSACLTCWTRPGWCPRSSAARLGRCPSCLGCRPAEGGGRSPSSEWSQTAPGHWDKRATVGVCGRVRGQGQGSPGLFFGHRLDVLVVGVENHSGDLFNWTAAGRRHGGQRHGGQTGRTDMEVNMYQQTASPSVLRPQWVMFFWPLGGAVCGSMCSLSNQLVKLP